MTFDSWIFFATVSAVNIVTPGPANLNTVQRALQLGVIRVWPTIAGNALGLALGAVICAAGMMAVVAESDLLWGLIRMVGVGYLTWLGLKLLLRRQPLELTGAATTYTSPTALFSEAFLLAATNPKALLFYLALFPQVLDPVQPLPLQAGILTLTYCGLSILSLSTYSTLAELLRRRFLTQTRYDGFRQISGLILLAFAARLLVGV